jgi:peptidoglycan-associated lipoprotein
LKQKHKNEKTNSMTKDNSIAAICKSHLAAESPLHQITNKNILTFSKLATLGVTFALFAGCSTDNFYQNPPLAGTSNNSQKSVPIATPLLQPQPKETVNPTSDATNAATSAESGIRPAWNEDRTSLAADKVYFAFDKSTIRSREHSKLNDVADFLKGNAQVSIRIEGNCDERGTEEFNRELGVRRATVSRDYLMSLGIDPVRIEILSRGKDNPAVTGEGGTDRALNRRDEFVILTSNKAL